MLLMRLVGVCKTSTFLYTALNWGKSEQAPHVCDFVLELYVYIICIFMYVHHSVYSKLTQTVMTAVPFKNEH